MDFSFPCLNLQLYVLPPINYNSVETFPVFEARETFTVRLPFSKKKPIIVDDTLSYVPWGGDNQMPFM